MVGQWLWSLSSLWVGLVLRGLIVTELACLLAWGLAVHVLHGPRTRSLYALYVLLAHSVCVPAGGLLTAEVGGVQWWDNGCGP